jgi:hypothetical protein
MTDPPTGQQSSPNQSSSERKSSEDDDNPGEAQSETTQDQHSDPFITELLRSTVGGSDELTDPATDEHLRKAT